MTAEKKSSAPSTRVDSPIARRITDVVCNKKGIHSIVEVKTEGISTTISCLSQCGNSRVQFFLFFWHLLQNCEVTKAGRCNGAETHGVHASRTLRAAPREAEPSPKDPESRDTSAVMRRRTRCQSAISHAPASHRPEALIGTAGAFQVQSRSGPPA